MHRIRLAIPLAFVLFLADCTTKDLAVAHLTPEHVSHPVVGDFVQFTLAYNDASAMGLVRGQYVRWPLAAVGVVLVFVLLREILRGARGVTSHQVALGLLLGGALGNLAGRIFSERGVVDFIDVGIGTFRFYLFNVADIALAAGVCLFICTSYRTAPRSPPGEALSP